LLYYFPKGAAFHGKDVPKIPKKEKVWQKAVSGGEGRMYSHLVPNQIVGVTHCGVSFRISVPKRGRK